MKKLTPDHAFSKGLSANIQGTRHAIKEFAGRELFAYLIENEIALHIRLKTGHKSDEAVYVWQLKNAAEKVKLRGRVQIEVFEPAVFVSGVKYRRDGKTECRNPKSNVKRTSRKDTKW